MTEVATAEEVAADLSVYAQIIHFYRVLHDRQKHVGGAFIGEANY